MHSADHVDLHTGYEWWLMKEAKARNPDIKLCVTVVCCCCRRQRRLRYICWFLPVRPVVHLPSLPFPLHTHAPHSRYASLHVRDHAMIIEFVQLRSAVGLPRVGRQRHRQPVRFPGADCRVHPELDPGCQDRIRPRH